MLIENRRFLKLGAIVAFFLLWAMLAGLLMASPQEKPYVYVPQTVSPEWQEALRKLPDPSTLPAAPVAGDKEGWKKLHSFIEERYEVRVQDALKQYEPLISERKLGGVPVLDIRPKGWRDNGRVLVYTHGGAYTLLSAHSTLANSVPVAQATGLRIISVDYTTAPAGKWQQVTDEVIAVIEVLKKEGYPLKRIAIYGDSAGGGLAAGVVLKMRDKGLGMPAVVVLFSPWSDITETGDTYTTLKAAEPSYLYDRILKQSADAYANPEDQKNSYVSPVYGDYSKGFPPTLIQGGTKEIFLSNFVRHYQALDAVGQTVKLDLYEGMPHVFQERLPESPEGKLALKKMGDFLNRYLTEDR